MLAGRRVTLKVRGERKDEDRARAAAGQRGRGTERQRGSVRVQKLYDTPIVINK